jgi:hypothetical protein
MQRIIVLLSLAVVLCLSASGVAKTNVDIVWDMQNNFNELFAAVNAELSPSFALELGVSTEGHMESGAGQTFAVSKLGLSYQNSWLKVFAGALPPQFNRAAGIEVHEVLLPDSSPSVPILGYTLEFGPVTYTKLQGDISRKVGFRRLGVHYLRWEPLPYLALGFGEAVVFSQPFPGDIYYYTVPILPYYLAKYLPGINTSIDNTIFYGDGRLTLPRLALYGALLINEFPMGPTETNPKLYAITLGLTSGKLIGGWDLSLEFSRVSDQAYSNARPENLFTYDDESLGHRLGDDLTACDIWLSGYLPKLDAEAKFGVYYQKLGNTDVAPWIGAQDPVPPEKTYGIKLGLVKPFEKLQLSFDLELGYQTNEDHVLDQAGYHSRAVIKGSWRLP